jgi:hypothetical protein
VTLQLQRFHSLPYEYQQSSFSRLFIHSLSPSASSNYQGKEALLDLRLVVEAGPWQFLHIEMPTLSGPLEIANLNHLRTQTDPVSGTSCLRASRIPDDGHSTKT